MIEPLLQAERLLIVGMLDQAEQLYRRVAEQDPRNSIARVGLARVALERGEDEVALAEARAALEIDPDNAAAVRMEVRLSEVLAQRRAPPSQPAPWESTAPPRRAGTSPPGEHQTPAGHAPPVGQHSTDEEPAPAADARPSERVIFARNPTMADHRRMQGVEPEAEVPPEVEAQRESAPDSEPGPLPARRPSLLDRLLGRGRRA